MAEENEEIKIGARNNRMDKQTIQAAHDAMVGLGAECEPVPSDDMPMMDMEKSVVHMGGEIKALDDSGKVGGYLVRFSTDDDPDLTGDYFTKETDLGEFARLPLLYHHGLDTKLGRRRIGTAENHMDDFGVWAEAQLNLRDEYEKFVFDMAKAGKLGYSSGAAAHTVEREEGRKASHITQWYMAEASLTPSPAEYRNSVIPIKSLLIPSDAAQDDKEDRDAAKSAKENIEMEANEIKTALGEFKSELLTELKAEAATAAKAAVTEVLDNLPEVKAKMNGKVQVTEDEADRPFKNVAEQLLAVKNLSAGRIDPRMKRIQAKSLEWMAGAPDEAKALLGSNEIIPSQGEFLLEPTISAEFLKPLHEEGPLTGLARRMPVGPNSINGWINGIDETSRAAGSRWGGVRGYWLSAGDTMTASQPKFKRINWELNQLAVLQYATDNMLRDAALMDSVIRQSALEELKFLVNDAFMRGSGAGQPKGILNGGAVLSVTRTDANNVDHADITRMVARINPDAYARMVWLASPNVMPEIDTLNFTAGSTGILSPYVTYGSNGVTSLRGRPVIYNEFSPSLGAVGDLLLWDPADYLYWEGAGVEGASSIHVQFLTNQTVFRFIYRVDGMPATTTALTPYQSTDTVSPYVALAATT
jgi:HK97 family phage major capsid protein